MWLKSSFLDVNSQLHSVQTCTLVIVNTLVGGIDALPVHSGFPKSPGRTRGFSRPFSAPGDAVAAATASAGPCSTRKCGPPLRSCGTSCDPASGKLPPSGLVTDTSRNGSFATSSLCPCPCSSAGMVSPCPFLWSGRCAKFRHIQRRRPAQSVVAERGLGPLTTLVGPLGSAAVPAFSTGGLRVELAPPSTALPEL